LKLKRSWQAAQRWGPALAVMAVIFVVSAQPKAVVPDFGAWDWNVKKAGHLLIYAALAVAWQHGLTGGRAPSARQAALAVILAGLYGATDEYHQMFVPGRGAMVVDVAIDTFGALLGVLGAWAARRLAAPAGSLQR
jgi:VanZ family protein